MTSELRYKVSVWTRGRVLSPHLNDLVNVFRSYLTTVVLVAVVLLPFIVVLVTVVLLPCIVVLFTVVLLPCMVVLVTCSAGVTA